MFTWKLAVASLIFVAAGIGIGIGIGAGIWKDSSSGEKQSNASGKDEAASSQITTSCIPLTDTIVPIVDRMMGPSYLVPLQDASTCFTSISLPSEFGESTLKSYDDIFSTGYGYYYYNNDVLKSSPISNPFDWNIYNGSSGGQVDYHKEFTRLSNEDITGMLPYQINDVLLQGRDAHTSTLQYPGIISLYDEHFEEKGQWPGRLTMDMTSNGTLQVINVNETSNKTVVSINGEDPVQFLRDITSNTGLGSMTQFKSAGVRLNIFLNGFASKATSDGVVWESYLGGTGDFRKLPAGMLISYDDGSTDEWTFRIILPLEFVDVPGSEIAQKISQNSAPEYNAFKDLQQSLEELDKSLPGNKSTTATRSLKAEKSPENPLGFEIYQEENSTVPYYSGYTIFEDMMVWKLPTFASPSVKPNKQIEFWNDMVEEANRNNITKLLIDISDNDGGNVDAAWKDLLLLYQGADINDVIQKFNVRISDPMMALWLAWDRSQDIWSDLLDGGNPAGSLSEQDSRLFDAVDESLLLDKFAASVGKTRYNAFWFNLDAQTRERLRDTVRTMLKTDFLQDDVLKLMTNFKNLTTPPKFCEYNPVDCFEEQKLWVMKQDQGGTIVNTTIPLLAGQFIDSDDLVLAKPGLVNTSQAAPSPFKSYYLLSNSQVVGSSANLFESGLRHLSFLYGNGTYPNVTTFSMGCFGVAEECEMSQFQGSIDDGGSLLRRMYSNLIPLKALSSILDILPESVLSDAGITAADVQEYDALVRNYAALLPSPPAIGDLPRFSTAAVFSPEIESPSIPQEFFERPADIHLPIWPAPNGMSMSKQTNLAQAYQSVRESVQ